MTRTAKQVEEALAALSQRVQEQISEAICQIEVEVTPELLKRLDDIESRLSVLGERIKACSEMAQIGENNDVIYFMPGLMVDDDAELQMADTIEAAN